MPMEYINKIQIERLSWTDRSRFSIIRMNSNHDNDWKYKKIIVNEEWHKKLYTEWHFELGYSSGVNLNTNN